MWWINYEHGDGVKPEVKFHNCQLQGIHDRGKCL